MLGLNYFFLLYFYFGSTILHIEFAEKSQKIRTVALRYKKLYKKKPAGGGGGGWNPPPAPNRVKAIKLRGD